MRTASTLVVQDGTVHLFVRRPASAGRTTWDGVKNALALKHLASVKPGDLVFIYHTGDEKAVIGVAAAVSTPYADPKKKDPKLLVVDLAPRGRCASPVTLAAIKASKSFAGFELVRLPRLSVMPVSEEQRGRSRSWPSALDSIEALFFPRGGGLCAAA